MPDPVEQLKARRAALDPQIERARVDAAAATSLHASLLKQAVELDRQIAAADKGAVRDLALVVRADGLYAIGKIDAGASKVRVSVTADGKAWTDRSFDVPLAATTFDVGPYAAEPGRSYYAWARVSVAGSQSPWSPTCPAVTVPLAPIRHRCLIGAIADVVDDALLDECGFDGTRLWGSYSNAAVIPAAVIKRANDFARTGRDVAICVTPATKLAVAPDATAVVEQLIAQADRRVRPNLVNEPNWGDYWPGRDIFNAFRAMKPHAARLRAAGFEVGSPSPTGFEEQWETWFAQLHAEGLLEPYDRLVFHVYGDAAKVRRQAEIARRIADRYGKKLDFDECGFTDETTPEQATAMLPEFLDAIALADYASFFILTKTNNASKPGHDRHPWLRDPKTGTRREAYIAAWKRELAARKTARPSTSL